MVDENQSPVSVTAAVIGSSNISERALKVYSNFAQNIEADVLICEADGPNAKIELSLMLQHLYPTYAKHLYKTY